MSRSFGTGPCSKLFSGARSCRRTGFTSPEHALETDSTALNQSLHSSFCLSMIFVRKPVPTFRDHALMLLLQVVEPLVMRHDDLQGAIARIRVRFPAIEAGYRPRRSVDLCVEPDDDHATCLLAAFKAAQLSGDQILDFDLGLGELVHMLPLGFSSCLPAECPLDLHEPAIGAMNNFGLLYVRNNGVKRNFFDARHWFEKAAAGGNAAAMNNLGLIYEQVHGVRLIMRSRGVGSKHPRVSAMVE